jgi:hypothetical protein
MQRRTTMKKQIGLLSLGLGLALLAATPPARADSLTFTLGTLPASGAISGPPGSTVGWGYTITNNSASYWLVTTGVSADPFVNGTPNAGIFDFPAVAPLSTLTVAYDPSNFLGLFEFTWDPNAPVGFVNMGTFVVTGEFWDNDPFLGGNFFDFAPDASAAYSVTATAVPEPSTLLLLATGVAGVAMRKRGLRKRHMAA